MSQALEVFYTVVAAHIPSYVMRVSHHNFGNGSSQLPPPTIAILPQLNMVK